MKKQVIVLLAGFVLGAGTFVQALAVETKVCEGKGGVGKSPDFKEDGTTFLRQEMKAKCSNNVYMSADQDTAKAWVAAGSSKGKSYWGGNTDGGSAQKLGTEEIKSGDVPKPGDSLEKAKTAGSST